MTNHIYKRKRILVLMPLFGSVLFAVLYLFATSLYPGGSQVDKNAAGFSWINNYWCNLLNDNAINGQPNPAKPVAMAGMAVLCATLTFFWLLFPLYLVTGKRLTVVIQVSGTLSMIIAFLLFTSINHDLITNLASLSGLIATAGVFAGLYKARWVGLLWFGILNLLLVVANNYVYYTKGLITYLPVLQKISFAAFLTWICCIDVNLFCMVKKQQTKDFN